MVKQRRVFITGGHLTPAIAVIDEMKKRALPWQVIFVGRTYALEGSVSRTQEYEEMRKRDIFFLSLFAGRISRVLTPQSLVSCIKIPLGFVQAFWHVYRFRPALIVSFGGYLALPIALAGWLRGVPLVTHEQTLRMGLANRIISFMAQKVLVSFRETITSTNSSKFILTGLPLRSELFKPPPDPSFSVSPNVPILYITGGSTGAVSLNELLFPLIPSLLPDWIVIHQTGSRSYEKANDVKQRLATSISGHYMIATYFNVTDVAWIYKHADLVIGRSGANTVWELAALGKIALLVPLPWAGGREQTEHARWLANKGSATVLSQVGATTDTVRHAVDSMWEKRKTFQSGARRLQKTLSVDGAARVVDILTVIDSA